MLFIDRVNGNFFVSDGNSLNYSEQEPYGLSVSFGCSKILLNFNIDVKILYSLYGQKIESFSDFLNFNFTEPETSLFFSLQKQIKAHTESYRHCSIDVSKYSSTDLIPEEVLNAFLLEKAKLCFAAVKKADKNVLRFYQQFYSKAKIIHNLSLEDVVVDVEELDKFENHYSEAIKKNLKDSHVNFSFNPVGAKTGRLTCAKESVNIFSIPKEMRSVFVAPKDYKLVKYDYKSFQPRIAIMCSGDSSFEQKFRAVSDIYSVFDGDREKNKIAFLQWLFSPESEKHSKFEDFARPIVELRNSVYEQVVTNGFVLNKFQRPLFNHNEKKNVVFQNYITSNEVDAILAVMKYLDIRLKNNKSKIYFPYHDALVFKIHKDEMDLIDEIKDTMENFFVGETFYCHFPVSAEIGDNFGDMTRV